MLLKNSILTVILSNLISTVHLVQIFLNDSTLSSIINEGEYVQLNCPFEIENNDTVNIFTWYKDDEKMFPILTDSRVKISTNIMVINQFLKSDSAFYHCEIVKGNGLIIQSKSVLLQLNSVDSNLIEKMSSTKQSLETKKNLPIFTNYYENKALFYYETMSLELDCSVFSSPNLLILWYKNGRVIGEEEYGLVRNKMIFKINDLMVSDSGEYRCQVANKNGEINRFFRIQVVQKEKITAKLNKPISFECNHSNANWYVYYKNKDLSKSDKSKISFGAYSFYQLIFNYNQLNNNDNQLIIANPSIFDNGLYVCMNNGVLSSKVFDLDVIQFKIHKNNLNSTSKIPLSIIFIIILIIFSIVMIIVLFCYYLIKLKNEKQIDVESNNVSSNLNQKREISSSMHHLSRLSIENNKLKRHSFIPMVINSTPTFVNMNKYQSELPIVINGKSYISNNSNYVRPIQLNYYPIYCSQNQNNQSLLSNSVKITRNI